jgi:hypothetical protein
MNHDRRKGDEIGRGYRRFTLMINEKVLNFEDEILLRGIDCYIPTLINRRILIKDNY